MKEWTDNKEYNPFNSNKLYAQANRWREIKRGEKLPPPTTISIDLINQCCIDCRFCNGAYGRTKNDSHFEEEAITEITGGLKGWESKGYKVSTSCLGGIGEPTMSKHLDYLIERLDDAHIGVGVVSNGVMLDRHHNLGDLDWLGVSVNAGTRKTYNYLTRKDYFEKVIKNIERLNKSTEGMKLQKPGQGYGISYKYLLTPQNTAEIYKAAEIAKDIGCRNIHIRPFGDPFDRKLGWKFTEGDIKRFNEQMELSRGLEDDKFGVFGITHKFNGDLTPNNDFAKCYSIFMIGAISPPINKKNLFSYNVCCDSRGKEGMQFDFKDFGSFEKWWGGEEHWKVHDKIKPKECPRCTSRPHQKIFEKAILEDNCTIDYI
jgi:MoaA/NifB/PqqE/SkfB family radical SAM enzyme